MWCNLGRAKRWPRLHHKCILLIHIHTYVHMYITMVYVCIYIYTCIYIYIYILIRGARFDASSVPLRGSLRARTRRTTRWATSDRQGIYRQPTMSNRTEHAIITIILLLTTNWISQVSSANRQRYLEPNALQLQGEHIVAQQHKMNAPYLSSSDLFMYIHTYIHIHIHIHIYTCMYIYISTYLHIYTHI